MIDELGTTSRALLDAARQGLAPDAAALQRVRAKVAGSVAGTARGAVVSAKAVLAIKLGVVAIVAAVATRVVVQVRQGQGDAVGVTAPLAQPAVAPTQPTPQPQPQPPPQPTPQAQPQPQPTPQQPTPQPKPNPRPLRPVAPAQAGLAREVELLDRAMASLRGGDLAGTLATIRTYDTETDQRGQLAEDAAAIEIEALCRTHDPAAAGRLDSFDQRWPRSAQRSRLAGACR